MKRLIADCIIFARRHRETLSYLIFGGLTTLVSYLTYYLFKFAGVEELVCKALSWILSVMFAFVTNKIFVFGSKSLSPGLVAAELVSFYSARLLTGAADMAIFWLGFEQLGINDFAVITAGQVVVIISNYFISKLFVFRKKGDKE